MKIEIPDLILEKIYNIINQNPNQNSFWGATQVETDNFEILIVEDVFSLPILTEQNIESILSQQEASFDIIIAYTQAPKELKNIQDICMDIGIYFHTLTKKEDIKNSPEKKTAIQKAPEIHKKTVITEIQENTTNNIPEEHFFYLDTSTLREIFLNPPEGFQKRRQQINMIKVILDSFESSSHAFIEAATGTGKSLSYLLPSILLAQQKKEKIIISTYTKTLQKQLIYKDIPKACELLGTQITSAIAKGKSNYLCLKRFFDLKSDIVKSNGLFQEETQFIEEFIPIVETFITENKTGDLDDINIPYRLRNIINMQSEICIKNKCPFFKDCFYFKTWALLDKCDLIVVNHSLLISQMEMVLEGVEHNLIPRAFYLVVDEAHHLKKTVLQEKTFSSHNFIQILNRLFVFQNTSKKGLLPQLSKAIEFDITAKYGFIIDKINQLEECINNSYEKLNSLFIELISFMKNKNYYRITEISFLPPKIKDLWENIQSTLSLIISDITTISIDMADFSTTFKEEHAIIYQQLNIYKGDLTIGSFIWSKLFEELSEQDIVWLETDRDNISVFFLSLDIKEFLKQTLWDYYKSVVLTSATLSVNKSLDSIKNELHFSHDNVIESILPPVFNYKKNLKFLGIQDIVAPTHPNFLQQSLEVLCNLDIHITGGILVLCTSWEQVSFIKEHENSIHRQVYIQGEDSIENLLKIISSGKNIMLVGVDSFWEGIDIPGQALECIVILKIPFKTPGHPIIDALYEIEEKNGNNPFYTVLLNDATLKFKQGFGRLLRTEQDTGIVVCLDNRILYKSYANTILSSLYTPIEKTTLQGLETSINKFLNKFS